MSGSRFKPLRAGLTLIELAIVCVLVTILVAVLYPAVQATRNPKGPHGAMIPAEPPDPANRISHPTGLSLIAPANWDQRPGFEDESPYLFVGARGTPGTRLKAMISVQRTNPPGKDVLQKSTGLTFHNLPAYELMEVERKSSFDDPAKSHYDLYVDRNGEWWFVQFVIAAEMVKLPPQIRQYIDTIELPKKRLRNELCGAEEAYRCTSPDDASERDCLIRPRFPSPRRFWGEG